MLNKVSAFFYLRFVSIFSFKFAGKPRWDLATVFSFLNNIRCESMFPFPVAWRMPREIAMSQLQTPSTRGAGGGQGEDRGARERAGNHFYAFILFRCEGYWNAKPSASVRNPDMFIWPDLTVQRISGTETDFSIHIVH